MDKKNEVMLQSERNKDKLLIPFIVALIGSLMLIVTLFLPFASATEDYKEYLQEYSDEMYVEELNMTNGDAVNISLFEFGRIYAAAADWGMSESIAIACLVIISAFTLFTILTTLFSVLKKPIVAMIFNLLSFGVFWLIKWDFEDRGVIPSNSYDWGIAEFVCYIGFAVVMVGAILLLMAKINAKRQNKALVKE